jgi:2-methylcitrate dehydratase PrpD
MKPLERLGHWVAALRWEAIPESARRAARCQLANMVAAVHASGRSAEAAAVARGVGDLAAHGGRATVLGTGRKHPPVEAAMVNAAWAMAHDFDDIIWIGHTCHSAVFASLAVAEHEGASTRDLVTAIVAANEVAGRIGASCFLGPLNGQMWTFIHLVGGAAAAARLLGLDGEKTTHALGIALAQPNFALQPGFMAPSSKLMAAATPTATGIQAAYLARAGVTGAADILEDRRGFWRRFAFVPLAGMLEGLGEFWAIETLTVKTHPGCHFFQTACEALDELLAVHGRFALEAVRAVEVATTKLGAEVTRFASDYAASGEVVTPVNVNFDLRTTAAILLHAGRLTSDEVDGPWLRAHSPAILAWQERVRVAHDPALTAKVVASARAVATGKAAVASIGPSELLTLVRRYRDEYSSSLVSAEEAGGWLRLAGHSVLDGGAAFAPPEVHGSAVPLAFPNRVTLELSDGTRVSAQVDVPGGSFASPGMGAALERKFLRESGRALGERAPAAFAACLAPEAQPLEAVVRQIAAHHPTT